MGPWPMDDGGGQGWPGWPCRVYLGGVKTGDNHLMNLMNLMNLPSIYLPYEATV